MALPFGIEDTDNTVNQANETERQKEFDWSGSDEEETAEIPYGSFQSEASPWKVTEGYQVAFWHCLTYCWPAIRPDVLFVAHAVHQLLSLEQKAEEESSPVIPEDRTNNSQNGAYSQLSACDATELLLRLCLRKKMSFTQEKIESDYGSSIKVPRSLHILELAQLHESGLFFACATSKRSRAEKEHSSEYSISFVSSFCGKRVARLMKSLAMSKVGDTNENRSSKERLLQTVLYAVPAPSLRRVAVAMHHFGFTQQKGSHHLLQGFMDASEDSEEDSLTSIGVPSRKVDIIGFLLQRLYMRNTDLSDAKSEQERRDKVEALIFSSVWDAQVGKVLVLAESVKYAVQYVARVFHILTSNLNASCIFPKDSFSLVPSVVANPPNLLLHYYQRFVLHRHIQAYHLQERTQDCRIPCSVSWSTSFGDSINRIQIFSSRENLQRYLLALQMHEKIFSITDGTSSYAKKLMARDEPYVKGIFQDAINMLGTFHKSKSVGKEVFREVVEHYRHYSGHVGLQYCEPLAVHLHRNVFLAAHFLQFTPQYRLYACLESVFPLLESLRLYAEAVKCLEVLLFRPLWIVFPFSECPCSESLPSTATIPSALSLYYRPEKRGSWWHRLAMDYHHLGEFQRALETLKAVHEKWDELSSLSASGRQELLEMTQGFLFTSRGPSDRPLTENRVGSSSADVPLSQIKRRARILRALWPLNSPPFYTKETSNNMALYHAAMEFVLERYCSRSDQINIEKLITVLHKKAFRWTPLSKGLQSTVSRLLHPPVMKVHGVRDSNNVKGWKDPERNNASFSFVEDMVLQHYLFLYNSKSRRQTVEVRNGPTWKGLHCEGKWIAYLSRILLWECFYWCGEPHEAEAQSCVDVTLSAPKACLWLSHFQDGPLDAMTPLLFSHRRRKLIDERLNYLTSLSTNAFLSQVAERCGGGNLSKPPHATDPFLQPTVQTKCELPHPPDKSSKCRSPFPSVFLNGFPLLEIVAAIPRKPLLDLLRCMFLGSTFDGYSMSTSGFPDLVLWKEELSDNIEQVRTKGSFQLFEVKSPSDELSVKQIAVNDCLLRCGFDVRVVRVKSLDSLKAEKS